VGNVLHVRNQGVPIVGFTWYSLTDQVDWDTALREDNGNVNPLGLYDLDRNIRAVGRAYKQLLTDWREVLPAQSVCLTVPLVLPSEYSEPMARRRREAVRRRRVASRSGGSRGDQNSVDSFGTSDPAPLVRGDK
jgi:hypothetical protein